MTHFSLSYAERLRMLEPLRPRPWAPEIVWKGVGSTFRPDRKRQVTTSSRSRTVRGTRRRTIEEILFGEAA